YNSTVSNNTAGQKGGGVYSSGRCVGDQSTFSTNTATGLGGGIYGYKDPDPALENNNYLELNWTTVGYNKGAGSGGVYLDNVNNTQTRSSIIAKNQLPTGAFVDYVGSPHTQDPDDHPAYKSVFGEITGTVYRWYDIIHLSNILPLANNGGPTKTHEIPTTSSALNKFVEGDDWHCLATDQRGLPRPRPVGAACDLGSYERQ
ncbi:MAG TPA: choice-of-anchor Q domain-containing protein, partial [Polyangia bacterium]|nr:choice-of-anchor Q domain-containing protein [Polyangia bacterium]